MFMRRHPSYFKGIFGLTLVPFTTFTLQYFQKLSSISDIILFLMNYIAD